MNSVVIKRAKAWAAIDPNKTTQEYVLSLMTERTYQELRQLFPSDGSRIGFGTAGLRSAMKPGPMGMNDLVVIQTTQGLARSCQTGAEGEKCIAVIGYDHRQNPQFQLSSKKFAMLAKLVFLEAGFHDVVLLQGYCATPHVAYAVSKVKATVGIMVTASHNPKLDAGYKVYNSQGCQIRHTEGIVNCIENNLEPWIDYGSSLLQLSHENDDECWGLGNKKITQYILNEYYRAIASSGLVATPTSSSPCKTPRICYTAMHGVGHVFAVRAFETFGLDPFVSVPEQQEPDYRFPTVSFPNPEAKGALNLAMKYAVSQECDVILANDPDADRLAVAEFNEGEWTTFTGNEIGIMLGLRLWDIFGKDSTKTIAMCASTVSSQMLRTIAQVEGFHFEDTLTGFKWIGSRMLELTSEKYNCVFGYEEAIGFCCGNVVADKDGLTALGVVSQLIISVYTKGTTLKGHLNSLYQKYGEHYSQNGYYVCHDPSITHHIFDKMRNDGNYLTHVGPYQIESIRDLGIPGYDSATPDQKPTLPTSKSSPMVTLRFVNGAIAHFRGSGTEPKFKYYLELRGQPGGTRDFVKKELQKMLKIIREELLEAHGLVR